MSGLDLRLAVRRGYLLLPIRGTDAVETQGRVLRYDPAIPPEIRRPLVLEATRPVDRKKFRRVG